MISLSIFGFLFIYLLQRLQVASPAQPHALLHGAGAAKCHGDDAGPCGQYGGQLFDQHELAVLFPRYHHELLHPDGGSCRAELRVRRGWNCRRRCHDSRIFARHTVKTIGNFWVDVTRCTVYILLPVCLVATLLFVWQGAIQNFKGPTTATTLEGSTQVIEQGPLASQEAIKMLGTNGGGYFNANSAHPYENPTPLGELRCKPFCSSAWAPP